MKGEGHVEHYVRRNYTLWKPKELALLDRLAGEGKLSWDEIGHACGHTGGCARSTYYARRKARRLAGEELGPRKDGRRPWSQDEFALLLQLREQGLTFLKIDEKLGRCKGSSYSRYYGSGPSRMPLRDMAEANDIRVSPEQVADRDERYQAWLRQSPAAALMGEPLPGRSALDLRRQGGAQ